MPIAAVKKVTQGQNGLGAFILQCKRLDFHYCDFFGSSRGMRDFIRTTLPAFAKANPQIEITVSPRPNHEPVVRGHYINGREKAICVRKMTPSEILEKVQLLRNTSGEKLKRHNKPVVSINESVRGIWSPYHRPKEVVV